MSDIKLSKLYIYSLGVVAVNKELGSDIIEVTATEILPFLDGELTDNVQVDKIKGKSDSGSSYEASANTSVTLQAKWLPFRTNRKTSPDVRRGEPVLIWRYADEDKFYWSEFIYDPSLRKLETVLFMISATRDESDPGTATSTYYVEISSHTKTITLHTSKADGEPFTYDFQINAREGNWTFTDDIGNFVTVDSLNRRIEIKNTDKSHVDIDRKDIRIYAPHNIELVADNDIVLTAKNNINNKAGNNINSKADSNITDEASAIKTKSGSTANDVPNTSFTGNISVAGSTTTKGMKSTSGGSFEVQGNGTFTGTVNVTKLISSQSIDAPNV